MQFLSDVYLRCPDCDGTRYRAEALEVKIERARGQAPRALSVADVLELTVSEATALFESDLPCCACWRRSRRGPGIREAGPAGADAVGRRGAAPEAGRLPGRGGAGQPVKNRKAVVLPKRLFMFDEPTTGLHFDDIAKLMRAFGKLLDGGHSLIVIEHNLDVIRAGLDRSIWARKAAPAARWCAWARRTTSGVRRIAYRPRAAHYDGAGRGRHAGGERARRNMACRCRRRCRPRGAPRHRGRGRRAHRQCREHNLKALNVDIPHGKFNVITGVSGSGKSTLAFDILFHEGQRRYLESLNAYARSIVQPAGRPEVDAVYGIPPTVAIEQRLSRGGRKSTVATTSEVWHFLRLLYVKLGIQHCVHDGAPVTSQSPASIVAQLLRDHRGQHVGLLAPLVVNRKGVYTDLAKWAKARGNTHLRVDGEFLPVDPWPRLDRFREHTIELPVGDIVVSPDNEAELRALLEQTLNSARA
jgi:excinuclease ABC subunit A